MEVFAPRALIFTLSITQAVKGRRDQSPVSGYHRMVHADLPHAGGSQIRRRVCMPALFGGLDGLPTTYLDGGDGAKTDFVDAEVPALRDDATGPKRHVRGRGLQWIDPPRSR